MQIMVNTDGGARGNPGPAAIGVVIKAAGRQLVEFGKPIGQATNNLAEYTAVSEALRYLQNQPLIKAADNLVVQFYIDSKLVVNQLNGTFKVKEPTLRELLMKIRMLEADVRGVVHYTYVPREQNQRADLLVNRTLDAFLMSS